MKKDLDFTAIGYPSVDHLIPCEGEVSVGRTALIRQYDDCHYYGGCNVNVAAFCGNMGMKTAVMMKVGKNFESIGFHNFLENCGVNLDGVKVIPEDYTSCSYLVSNGDGDHVTLFYPGAMDERYPYCVDEEIIRRSRLGIITVGNSDYNRDFMEKCHRNNVPILLGMKWDTDAFPKDFLGELLRNCQILVMNEYEKEQIEKTFGLDEITDCFKSLAAQILVVTRGRHGSDVYQKAGPSFEMHSIPIADIGKRVDTAGVGDAYIAGFVKAYLDGKDVLTCGRLGTVTSSFIVEKTGCLTNMQNFDAVKKRYAMVYSQDY